MSTAKTMGTNFTEGRIMPMLVKFFLPFLLANVLNSIYNTVDTIIIGRFVGSTGILAVTLGGKMLNLFSHIGLAFAGGGQVMISQQIGAHKREELNSTIGTLFTEMFCLSLVFSAITLTFSRQILLWLNTPAESYAQALAYLRITAAGLPLIFGYNAVSAVLRGMGDSKSPLLFIAIAATANLIGDLVFIVCFDMGAAGTAYATVIGQGLSLLFSITLLYKRRERFGFDFRLKSFAIHWGKLKTLLRLGYPVAIRFVCITGTQLVMMGYVNLYGLVEAAAYSIGDKIIQLTNIFHMSIKQAAGSMVGQNIGAGKNDRVTIILKDSLKLTCAAATLLSAVALLFPYAMFGLFTDDSAVLAYARIFMCISCIIFILSAFLGPYDAIITGTGNSRLSLLGGVLDGVVFRVCFSFLFAYTLGMGTPGFFLGDALARLGPIIVSMVYYYTGAWKRFKRLA